ncbi:unnamed protein product [Caenorhabditis angaria]|uniref:CRC domain-containing protein n=1 Tax=Caenorhabditis angaria TaxID=860376 RepID=A0A9P1N126_9PELO|nr:unnamed protein product [Caenorhabditis angaria]
MDGEESQFFEEGEEIYDDYGDGAEYIEIDGRLVLHNPSHARREESEKDGEKPEESTPTPTHSNAIKEEDPSPAPSSSSEIPKTTWVSSETPPPYFGKAPYKLAGHIQHKAIPVQGGMNPYKSSEANQQRKAFFEMKEQVIQHRQKNKKKIIAPGQRKPCNCNKSQCLKLYCDCFANGEFCRDCNCKDCHNNVTFDSVRTKAIRQSLERNPNAFKPKIGIGKGGKTTDIERLHQKGCQCKKSGCLKNYCECYEAKVPCTDRCKCRGCQNTEQYRNSRYKGAGSGQIVGNLLGQFADNNNGKNEDNDEEDFEGDDCGHGNGEYREEKVVDPRKFPWFYMTDEVVEATTLCMVAQAEEALNSTQPEVQKLSEVDRVIQMERLVLREFGRCLEQIISNSVDVE